MRSRIKQGLAAITLTGVLVGGSAVAAHAASGSSSSSKSSSASSSATASSTSHNGDKCPNM